jgi:RHS repeat-associated protein
MAVVENVRTGAWVLTVVGDRGPVGQTSVEVSQHLAGALGESNLDPNRGGGNVQLRVTYDGQIDHATRDAQTISYLYDEGGQRILKSTNGAALVAYVEGATVTATELDEPVRVGNSAVGLLRNGSFALTANDVRGTVEADTGGAARLASPFGARPVHPDVAATADYAATPYDADLGADRMGVRDYDARIGRFLEPDPLFLEHPEKCADSPIECNLYGYARNRPLDFVDPKGTEGKEAGDFQGSLSPGYPWKNTSYTLEGCAANAECNTHYFGVPHRIEPERLDLTYRPGSMDYISLSAGSALLSVNVVFDRWGRLYWGASMPLLNPGNPVIQDAVRTNMTQLETLGFSKTLSENAMISFGKILDWNGGGLSPNAEQARAFIEGPSVGGCAALGVGACTFTNDSGTSFELAAGKGASAGVGGLKLIKDFGSRSQ